MLIHHHMLVINSQFCWFSSLPAFKRDLFLVSNSTINGKRDKKYTTIWQQVKQKLKKIIIEEEENMKDIKEKWMKKIEENSNYNSNCLLEATLVVLQTHDRALLV